MRPSQPPSSLPLLIFLHSVLFVNAYMCGSCCAVSAAWPCGASEFDPHSCPVPTQGGSYFFSIIADILQVRSSCAAAAHCLCHGHSCACWLPLLLLTRAPSDSCCVCTRAAAFARASRESQGRLKKAILEYVILQGSSIAP